MRDIHNLVGIHTKDTNLPGTLYLTDDGDLTKDPGKARKVELSKLQRALKEISGYSKHYFIRSVTD